MTAQDLADWIGRRERMSDVVAGAPLRGLAALFDELPLEGAPAPLLAHWLFFLPTARQSEIDDDGHPKRGDFLPPIALPRRMWVGGKLDFAAPLLPGLSITRESTLADISFKRGRSGEMAFIRVSHEITAPTGALISETQEIVYRQAAQPGAAPPRESPESTPQSVFDRALQLGPVELFRFSALTFNAHRIHYDRDYAVGVEGYSGLVIQGPFLAMLMLRHFQVFAPNAAVTRYEYRLQRPAFADEAFELGLVGDPREAEVFIRTKDGAIAARAKIEAR